MTCYSEPANPSSRNPYPRDLSVISVALVIGKYSTLWEGHPLRTALAPTFMYTADAGSKELFFRPQ